MILSKDIILSLPRTPFHRTKTLKKKPGIYFFISNDKVWYVGMTTNFNKRFYSHHLYKEYIVCADATISILPFKMDPGSKRHQLYLLAIERAYIYKFKPEDNGTSGEAISIEKLKKIAKEIEIDYSII